MEQPPETDPNQYMRTFGTYNVLFPRFAIKWKEPEGTYTGTLIDNWPHRKTTINSILTRAWLDVYLLQEIGVEQLEDIYVGHIKDCYAKLHAPHIGRSDGLAILYKKCKYELISAERIPHQTNGHVSLFAKLRDKSAELGHPCILVGSIHFAYTGGSPQIDDVIEYLGNNNSTKEASQDSYPVIFGGDCNKELSSLGSITKEYSVVETEKRPTRHGRHYDWIFYKKNGHKFKEIPHVWTKAAFDYSTEIQPYSGHEPSDHRLFAAAFDITH